MLTTLNYHIESYNLEIEQDNKCSLIVEYKIDIQFISALSDNRIFSNVKRFVVHSINCKEQTLTNEWDNNDEAKDSCFNLFCKISIDKINVEELQKRFMDKIGLYEFDNEVDDIRINSTDFEDNMASIYIIIDEIVKAFLQMNRDIVLKF